ncbi:endonuclease III [Faecalicoccus pleomorphus]|uniref:endonuclease III n=1 Tax=Faecalicoccus pleomorphus TaxID=1323 RepID=UPI00195FCF41|nr:endonuclease III [Faecalicoccus pleomorphus]MBM6766139.1 endonuclease III [Faecalicoccus pleomorphus]
MNANEILDVIEEIFPNAKCELLHESPFQLLVAVVLSAQTTDESVNKVTPALFKAYPTSKEMARATISNIEPYIRRIGLYRNKARSISALSKDLEAKFNGVVPSSYKDLMSLAGVGRKTANVVRSVAFDIPSFAVDTHVDRVSKRLGLAKPYDSVEKVEEKLKRKIDRDRWNQGHHDFIFFGRYLCTARHPQCQKCPFTSFCRKDKLEAYKQKAAQK